MGAADRASEQAWPCFARYRLVDDQQDRGISVSKPPGDSGTQVGCLGFAFRRRGDDGAQGCGWEGRLQQLPQLRADTIRAACRADGDQRSGTDCRQVIQDFSEQGPKTCADLTGHVHYPAVWKWHEGIEDLDPGSEPSRRGRA